MKHFVIYVPGLGDKKVRGQLAALKTWKIYGVSPCLFHMKWYDQEGFDSKLERLLELIDTKSEHGYKVSLVGASAGASAALIAFSKRQQVIHKIVLIAGEVYGRDHMSPRTYRQNKSFHEAMQIVEDALADIPSEARHRILSIRALFDPVVAAQDSIIKDAHNKVVITSGHAVTIALQISLGAGRWLRFIKENES